MRRLILLFSLLLALAAPHSLLATIFGSVRGIVHDPQHRPIQNAQVTLKADDSDYSQTRQSNDEGSFEFDAVPIGNYTVTVTLQNFSTQQQAVLVRSETSPVLHFELSIAGTSQTTVVSGAPAEASIQSVTPTSIVSRIDVQNTPGRRSHR